eukprot:TRINITY_DN4291_c0_g1_i1.p1 TRINITY_DN4291_c0_g1~~TRINITY_DN4291_c0_g1_i1.p1  ORF type:complete len:311 (+),score=70.86 TRINITY_DN4291_c0_g1_i1:71-1003(+)
MKNRLGSVVVGVVVVLILICGAVAGQKLVPGNSTYFSFQRPEGLREFWVWVPSNYDKLPSDHSWPLSFFYHGLGGDYDSAVGLGITKEGEKRGYITISGRGTPSVTPAIKGVRAWNGGTCCQGGTADDVKYTQMAISMVMKVAKVNPKRIFALGISNGGYMVERLACESEPLFAGIASCAGNTLVGKGGQDGQRSCDKSFGNGKLNYIHLHGLDDFVVPWSGEDIHHGEKMMLPSILSTAASWATRMGCQGASSTLRDGPITNLVWNNCRGGTRAELVTVAGHGHEWFSIGNFTTQNYVFNIFDKTVKGN